MSKYSIERYRLIDAVLQHNSYVNLEAIRFYVNNRSTYPVVVSQIQKDIWAMRNCDLLKYYSPIRYHKRRKGYYYDADFYTINIQLLLTKINHLSLTTHH
jgi:hypothetical protein